MRLQLSLFLVFFIAATLSAVSQVSDLNVSPGTYSPGSGNFQTDATAEGVVKFNRKTSRSGLSQSFIKSITSDKNGFIWIGTTDGLNKYDGYTFKIYQSNPKIKGTLSGSNINAVYTDKRGTLYVAPENGGLNIYNSAKDNFTVYKSNPKDAASIVSDRVTAIFEDSKGVLWIGLEGNGLEIFDRKTLQFKKAFRATGKTDALFNDFVRCITEDKDGNLWVGTDYGVSVLSNDRKTFTNYFHTNDPKSISTNVIRSMFTDSEGQVWIGTAFGGLNLFDKKSNGFIQFKHSNKPNSLLGDYVPGICEAKDGKIWIATNWGASVYNKKTRSFTNYTNDAFDTNSLVDNGLNTAYTDAFGNIWIGSIAGISVKEATNSKFPNYSNNPGDNKSLGSKEAFSFYEDQQKRLWIGLREGFDQFDRQTQTFIHHHTTDKGKRIGTVMSFFEDKKKNLWIGTFDEGLYKYDQKNNHYELFDGTNYFTNRKIPLKDIWFIQENTKGELYIASYSSGVYKYDEKKNQFVELIWQGKTIPAGGITCFYIDRQSNLWIASAADGLVELNKEKGIYKAFKSDPAIGNTIISNDISAITEDKKGNLWIGTKSGLSCMNSNRNTITNYTDANLLNSNKINAILEDNSGDIWLSTNKGFSKFSIADKSFKNFNIDNGFDYNEFLERSAYKLQSGELAFGGLNGFNLFNPQKLVTDEKLPRVVITDFQLFNKSVSLTDKDSPLKKVINETSQINLSYRQNIFSFEFIALNLLRTKENQYEYKLEGFEKDWVRAGTSKKASYTNIPPGKYIFKVKASNNDGVWNKQGASIRIIVTPPFWMTWWFKAFVIITILAALPAFICIV